MNRITYCTFLALFFAVGCTTTNQLKDLIPKHDNFDLASQAVDESRVINVWTPPTYDDSDERFPVLYMPDGGIQEDFPHIANTLGKLIKSGSIPPVILVGIENTERRRDLTGFSEVEDDAQYCPLTDGAKNFRTFITDELIPEIHKRYRTNTKRAIIGESLAGLFVVETFMLHTESFDCYIAMDPSLWWNGNYLARNANRILTDYSQSKSLWFAGSDAEDISKYTNQLAATLTEVSPENLSWKYSDEPTEQHHTIFRATKEKALIWSLNQVSFKGGQ